jgi:cysteinyl-tRNA synthetase
MDFAVWKAAKPGEPAWDSPWGKGRPGWHIECSAMNLDHLGTQIDIHGGGNDLIFPHHENEIAQTEAITGKPFARYWMHNGMLQLKGEKMSKSLGNLISINDFLSEHPGDVMRLIVLTSNYRSPLTFNDDVIEANQKALDRLLSALKPALPNAAGASAEVLQRLAEQVEATQKGFNDSMDDDFNSAGAVGNLFDLVRSINQARAENATDEQLAPAQTAFKALTDVLGLEMKTPEAAETNSDAFIDLLVSLRQDLRKNKNYDLADKVRQELAELGVVIEDTAQGSSWHWE